MAQLEARLSRDSHNSSKAPSSDGYGKKPKSLRKRSGKKPGGAPGHKGCTLKRVAEPDIVVIHPHPHVCEVCGAALQATGVEADSRQVFDLPPARLEVAEHRLAVAHCCCGKVHRARFPAQVADALQYGPRLKAMIAYLTQYQLLPVDRTRQLLRDCFGASLSGGTIQTVGRLNRYAPALALTRMPSCATRLSFTTPAAIRAATLSVSNASRASA